MSHAGGCLCGAVRYEVSGDPNSVSICHCRDCQRSAGAPMVTWAEFPDAQFKVTQGTPRTINSSGSAMRTFCPECGSGLFYRNAEYLPGMVEVQATTLDDPAAWPPTFQIQTAEQQAWVGHLGTIKAFERFP
ncbi:MAG: GFA family protein [Betaproteobacteria bacterium]|nr:GFA family protein [Betaproteobacteria bacterium]